MRRIAQNRDAPTQVTVRRSGQMVLTPAAVAMLGDGATHVQFGYDPNSRTVALRAAPNGAKGRYRLRSAATRKPSRTAKRKAAVATA